MSCQDDNPMFIDFIPIITKAWAKMGVKPVYGIVTDGKKGFVDFGDRIEYYFPYIDEAKINYNDPTRKKMYQAEMLRMWLWKQLYTDGFIGNAIFSDIDMMPLSKAYFQGTAAKYSDDQMISYCDDATICYGQIASCYILANTKQASEMIEQETWHDFAWWVSDNCGPTHGADQWALDWMLKKYEASQRVIRLGAMVNCLPKNEAGNVVRLKRGWKSDGQALNRLDRDGWRYSNEEIGTRLVDCHCLRPYANHKDEIDKICNLIP